MRPCHSFLRHERVLGIGRLVFLFRQCIPLGIGGGTGEIISNINWSLRSPRYDVGTCARYTMSIAFIALK